MLTSLFRGLKWVRGRHRAGRVRQKPHRNLPAQRRSCVPRLDVLEDHTLLSGGFGRDGIVTTDFRGPVDSFAFDVAVQPDGKTVVAGPSGRTIALARYNANGSLDTTFGTGGTVVSGGATPAWSRPACGNSLLRSKVTAAGMDELKKALPKCKIEWDGGVIEPR